MSSFTMSFTLLFPDFSPSLCQLGNVPDYDLVVDQTNLQAGDIGNTE